MALDGSGRVYCSDYFGDRIVVYNASTGALLSYLTANDSLVAPSGLAWDPVYGGLIVANTNEGLWLRLSAEAQLLPFFPLNPSLPSPSTSNLQPGGAAVDGEDGALLLGYYWAGFVEKYAANGSLLWRLDTSTVDKAHTRGVTVDAAGDVWASDWLHSRIFHLSSDGQLLATYNSSLLLGPQGLAFDAGGALVVAASRSDALLRFNVGAELELLQAFSGKRPPLDSPAGLAIDSSGNIWCGDAGNGRVLQFAPSGGLLLSLYGNTYYNQELTALSAVYVPALDRLIVAVWAKLQLVGLDGSVGDQLSFDPPLQIDDPCGLAVAPSGAVLLASPQSSQLLQLDINAQAGANSSWSVFASSPTINLTYNSSPDVDVDASGNVYLADTAVSEVLMLSSTGVVEAAFTTSEPQLSSPAGIAVLPDGSQLYAADHGNNRVVRWTTADSRTAPSQVWNISAPVGLVLDPLGNVFAAASGTFYQLLPDGSVAVVCYSALYLGPTCGLICTDYTTFLTVDISGTLYLADPTYNRLVVCPAAAAAPQPPALSSTAPSAIGSSSTGTASSSSSSATTPAAWSSPSAIAASSSAAMATVTSRSLPSSSTPPALFSSTTVAASSSAAPPVVASSSAATSTVTLSSAESASSTPSSSLFAALWSSSLDWTVVSSAPRSILVHRRASDLFPSAELVVSLSRLLASRSFQLRCRSVLRLQLVPARSRRLLFLVLPPLVTSECLDYRQLQHGVDVATRASHERRFQQQRRLR